MKIILLACMASNRVIGNQGQIPWMGQFPEDMSHFRELTLGRAVIMGRKTFQSIGVPLKERQCIVVSHTLRQPLMDAYEVRNSLEAAINHCRVLRHGFCFIIGGAQIYRQAMQYADNIFLTTIKQDFEGDAYFPAIDVNQFEFEYAEEHKSEHFTYSYDYYVRRGLRV
jgi:dihydrofolate reductase